VGILTRARDALLARAGDEAAKRARVAPFVTQFEGWIAAARG